MAYDVPESVVTDAKLCPHGYVCLSEGDGHVRQADHLVPGDGVFVPGSCEVDCPYAKRSDGGVCCSCPVRIELFKRYHL